MSVQFRIATANLGRGVSVARFTANVRLISRRLRGATIGFQEIDEADLPAERRIIGTIMRPWWSFAGRKTKVMIAVPRTWRRVREQVEHASSGVAGASPTRYIVTVIIKKRRSTLPAIAVVNVHLPYVNPKHSQRLQQAASAAWHDAYGQLTYEVKRLHDKGFTVFVTSDTNKVKTPIPHADAVVLVGNGEFDKVWCVEGNVKVKRTAHDEVDLTIDNHDALVARCELTAA